MRVLPALMLCCAGLPWCAGADLTSETQRGFDRYVQLTEERLSKNLNTEHFLYSNPTREEKAGLLKGDVLIRAQQTLDHGKEIEVPGGLVQDWVGVLFIPRATIEQVRAVLEDYPSYVKYYKPEVIDSRVTGHHDGEYDIFLRLYKRQFVTVVLNANYHVKFDSLDANHLSVNSRSTRIAEVRDPARPSEELPVGHDNGFLWALNSYWRLEQADGGVYAQLEAVSLSRDMPFGLMWLKGFLQKFPKDSMQATLKGTKRAVEARQKTAGK